MPRHHEQSGANQRVGKQLLGWDGEAQKTQGTRRALGMTVGEQERVENDDASAGRDECGRACCWQSMG